MKPYLPKGLKVPFMMRLKIAYNAFRLRSFDMYLPYRRASKLGVKGVVCDNNRRLSNCKNEASEVMVKFNMNFNCSDSWFGYYVCKSCAEKFEGSMHGEPFDDVNDSK